jgi:hypothetical protein
MEAVSIADCGRHALCLQMRFGSNLGSNERLAQASYKTLGSLRVMFSSPGHAFIEF